MGKIKSTVIFVIIVVFILWLVKTLAPKIQNIDVNDIINVSPTVILNKAVETGKVSYIYDGDTIKLSDGRKVRYIGIDAPELSHPNQQEECFANESRKINSSLVLGKTVYLEKDVTDLDRYGRLLRIVYVDVDGQRVMVNEYLASHGAVFMATYPPDVNYVDKFLTAQKPAREHNLGLWNNCTFDQTQRTKRKV